MEWFAQPPTVKVQTFAGKCGTKVTTVALIRSSSSRCPRTSLGPASSTALLGAPWLTGWAPRQSTSAEARAGLHPQRPGFGKTLDTGQVLAGAIAKWIGTLGGFLVVIGNQAAPKVPKPRIVGFYGWACSQALVLASIPHEADRGGPNACKRVHVQLCCSIPVWRIALPQIVSCHAGSTR